MVGLAMVRPQSNHDIPASHSRSAAHGRIYTCTKAGDNMLRKRDIVAFVDWKSQVHNARQVGERRLARQVDQTLSYITKLIDNTAHAVGGAERYDVTVRLYHGWHRGLTKTDLRMEIDRQLRDCLVPSVHGRCYFNWRAPFGDRMLAALDQRLHHRLGLHLPDTLRSDFYDSGREREKMVDTALASDLLTIARSEPYTLKLLLAEDDDFVPAAYVAEKWSVHGARACLIVRKRPAGHLNLAGMLHSI